MTDTIEIQETKSVTSHSPRWTILATINNGSCRYSEHTYDSIDECNDEINDIRNEAKECVLRGVGYPVLTWSDGYKILSPFASDKLKKEAKDKSFHICTSLIPLPKS